MNTLSKNSGSENTERSRFKRRSLPVVLLLIITVALPGCFSYSFTGTSIPEGANSIFIPFFADQSSSGIGDLSDEMNQILVDRFVDQTRLQLANNRSSADAILEGQITRYSNEPFSVNSEEEASQNQVRISVRATYQYTSDEQPVWNQSFSGSSSYDPNENPIEGERDAARLALEQVVNNMFNDAVSDW